MLMGLDALRPGCEAVVAQIHVDQELSRRLEDFGFVVGTRVRCCYRSPCGKMTAIACRGTVIALRTREITGIRVRCL